jgi:hypothetical protein
MIPGEEPHDDDFDDTDAPAFTRATGEALTGRQRLELLAKHWTEHVRGLQEAATAR